MKTLLRVGYICLSFFCVLSSSVSGIEIYSIIHKGCQANTGLIIGINTEDVFQLDINGKLVKTSRNGIENILVYNTLDNPINQLDLTDELRDFAREVEVQAEEDTNFIGWPIRFLEELIVFYDIEGKTHLVDIDMIQRFAVPETISSQVKSIKHFKTYQFGFGNNLPECGGISGRAKDVVQPTRMLSDKIKIAKFLSVYTKGFTKLNRFQKRTSFYARPYLYDKKTKVGIVAGNDDFRAEIPQFPLNFQWPSGSNFGPQGILNIGSHYNEFLPNVEPIFGLKFEGKYHFLSVYFAGNPNAFSFGSDFIVNNRALFQNFFSKYDPDDPLVFPHYNQTALTGLEWGAYSISGGYYYPIICLQGNGLFREILAEQSMPLASFLYTTGDMKVRVLLSDIRLGKGKPSEDNIRMIYAEEMSQGTILTTASKDLANSLEDYSLHSQFLRFNLDLDLNEETRISISEVIFQGEYEEILAGSKYELNFNQYITSVRVKQEFGDYVSLTGFLNYYIRQYQSKTEQDDKESGENKISFAMVVEFIL